MRWAAIGGRGVVFVAGIVLGCSTPQFACVDSASCDLLGGGICEPEGFCSYPDDDCPSGHRFHAHAPTGIAGVCVSEPAVDTTGASSTDPPPGTTVLSTDDLPDDTSSSGTSSSGTDTGSSSDTTTGAPECPDWEVTLDLCEGVQSCKGKATGIARLGDELVVVGFTSVEADRHLVATRRRADGTKVWETLQPLPDAVVNQNTWARVAVVDPDGVDLVYSIVVGSARFAPAFARVNADGAFDYIDTTPQVEARAIRGATMIDDESVLVTGIDDGERWYDTYVRGPDAMNPGWTAQGKTPAPLTADVDAVTAHAAAIFGETVLVGGTQISGPSAVGWWQPVPLATGVAAADDACKLSGIGITTVTRIGADAAYFGGYAILGDTVAPWIGRVAATDTGCTIAWEAKLDTGMAAAPSTNPEFHDDVILAAAPWSSDRVVFVGVHDDRPWIWPFVDANASLPGAAASRTGLVGRVHALAVDEDCAVLAGERDGQLWIAATSLAG